MDKNFKAEKINCHAFSTLLHLCSLLPPPPPLPDAVTNGWTRCSNSQPSSAALRSACKPWVAMCAPPSISSAQPPAAATSYASASSAARSLEASDGGSGRNFLSCVPRYRRRLLLAAPWRSASTPCRLLLRRRWIQAIASSTAADTAKEAAAIDTAGRGGDCNGRG